MIERATPVILATLALLLVPGMAGAQTTIVVDRIDILDYGLYTAAITGSVASPGTASGTSHTVSDVQFYRRTDRVPASVGTSFGVKFVVVGRPSGEIVELRTVLKIPPPGVRNPKTGNVYRETSITVQKVIGHDGSLTGYTLDEDWELVTGPWTLELWLGDRRMLSKTFTVYTP